MLPRAGDHVPDPARLAEAHSIQVALVTSAWRAAMARPPRRPGSHPGSADHSE